MTPIPDRERADGTGANDRPLTVPLLVRGGFNPTVIGLLFVFGGLAGLCAFFSTFAWIQDGDGEAAVVLLLMASTLFCAISGPTFSLISAFTSSIFLFSCLVTWIMW